jgi:hypothetical protein
MARIGDVASMDGLDCQAVRALRVYGTFPVPDLVLGAFFKADVMQEFPRIEHLN